MQTRRDVFQAIADPTRREIINLIAYQSLNLNAIAENFNVSRPAISQHIKVLTECGLIIVRKQGRERYCEARLKQLNEVSDWIERYRRLWDEQFDALDEVLEELKAKAKKKSKKK
jgi:DNA-binding transcriptional ArsR family regulator